MARPVTLLVVFFLGANLFMGMLGAAGMGSMLGITTEVGGDENVSEITSKDQVNTGAPTGSTLFGMYNVLTGQITNIFHFIFPGLAMLHRAGVPSMITAGFLAPLFSVLIVFDVISFIRGWGL